MEHERTLLQQIRPLLPLLRLPLLVTDIIAMSLAFSIVGNNPYSYDKRLYDVCTGLGATFAASLVMNAVLSASHLKVRRVQLLLDTHNPKALPALVAGLDLTFGITFLALYIVIMTANTNAYYWWGFSEALKDHVAMGALVALIFHFCLAALPAYTWIKNYRHVKTRCPTCQQTMRTGAVVASPPLRAVQQSGSKKFVDAVANEAGESEGDRLITPGPDE